MFFRVFVLWIGLRLVYEFYDRVRGVACFFFFNFHQNSWDPGVLSVLSITLIQIAINMQNGHDTDFTFKIL